MKKDAKEEEGKKKETGPASKIGAGAKTTGVARASESKIGGGVRPLTAKPKEDDGKPEGVTKRTIAARRPLKKDDAIPEEES